MVDLAEIQAAYYMVAATGVIIAAVFYVLNLRETARNRRIALTTSLMQPTLTKEGMRDFIDIVRMDWSDFEDFKEKYDSRVNPDNFAKRLSMWNYCEVLGSLCRDGLIDIRTLAAGRGLMIMMMWLKFKPVIEMYRGNDYSPNSYSNFQYVAEELIKYECQRDSANKEWVGRLVKSYTKTQ